MFSKTTKILNGNVYFLYTFWYIYKWQFKKVKDLKVNGQSKTTFLKSKTTFLKSKTTIQVYKKQRL
jgi:hypothetical protein